MIKHRRFWRACTFSINFRSQNGLKVDDLGNPWLVPVAPGDVPEHAWRRPRGPRIPKEDSRIDFGAISAARAKVPGTIFGRFRTESYRNSFDPNPCRSQLRTDLFRSETLSIQTSADLSYSVQSRPSVIGLTVPWPHLGQIGPSALILVPKTRLGAGPMSPRVKNKFLDQNSGSNLLIKFCDRIS